MTTPTTNLLEWIDERIGGLQIGLTHLKTRNLDTDIQDAVIEEMKIVRARILQEVENEKAVIEKAYTDGNRLEYYDATESMCKDYYQTTFNPNNDESNS